MKRIIFIIVFALLITGCNNKEQFGFTSNNCNEVYNNCLNKCLQSGKTRVDCLGSCDKSRGMCRAVKTKGCMQNCNKTYGKNTASSESCKRSCANNTSN